MNWGSKFSKLHIYAVCVMLNVNLFAVYNILYATSQS